MNTAADHDVTEHAVRPNEHDPRPGVAQVLDHSTDPLTVRREESARRSELALGRGRCGIGFLRGVAFLLCHACHPIQDGYRPVHNGRDETTGGVANVTKAIRVSEHGGPEAMRLADTTVQAEPGRLLVDVAAAGVNFIDTYQRSGVYSMSLPSGLGLEGAGTVRAVGEGVSGFAPGDRVAWSSAPGSYAEQVAVPADAALPVPDGVELRTAAAAMLQGLTAHYLVRSTYPVGPGDVVLLHAAAGGVGLLLIQLAKAQGARVIGTASTGEKRALATGAGADEVLPYEGFDERVRELTDGRGASVVYDGVGKDTFDQSLASLRQRGYLVLFGGASGQVPPFDPQRLNSAGSVYLTRPSIGPYTADAEELRWRANELFGAIAEGALRVRIGGSYPLAEAAAAHRDLEARQTTGKLVLVP